jgi:hypothetical protein
MVKTIAFQLTVLNIHFFADANSHSASKRLSKPFQANIPRDKSERAERLINARLLVFNRKLKFYDKEPVKRQSRISGRR